VAIVATVRLDTESVATTTLRLYPKTAKFSNTWAQAN
jgi:hypothetical protein